MYTPYLTPENYSGDIPQELIERQLLQASRHIDTLTFNRIVGKFDSLTEFQKGIVSEVCNDLATWEYENADMLSSTLKGYSVNGVSAEFGGSNFQVVNGVAVPTALYETLKQTGLCCRRFGRYL